MYVCMYVVKSDCRGVLQTRVMSRRSFTVLVVLRVSVIVSSATATLIAQTRPMRPTAVSAQCRCLTYPTQYIS